MRVCFKCLISVIFVWVHSASSVSQLKRPVLFNSDTENELADLITSKGYLPTDSDLSKTAIVKSNDNDATFLLSKLSDAELVKLLSAQPKKDEYDLSDIVKLAMESKNDDGKQLTKTDSVKSNIKTGHPYNDGYDSIKRFKSVPQKYKGSGAYFRLNDKPVDPYSINQDSDPNYVAYQKLSNMLYSRPSEVDNESEEEDYKKELLFDVLVSQLKTLCCKKKRRGKKASNNQFQTLVNFNRGDLDKSTQAINDEQLFLIINDEIKGNGSDELIYVDPDSLESNSTVLLLGPITTPMTDRQLKSVMNRISSELSKPEYASLLQQMSKGTLSDSNVRILKSLVTGPETRRYIKPHRCNHQSKLARIYGGPKWIICTGYLNLNRPSIYD